MIINENGNTFSGVWSGINVLVERPVLNVDFTVNYNLPSGIDKAYKWRGAKAIRNGEDLILDTHKQMIPKEIWDDLEFSTTTVKDGQLRLVEKEDEEVPKGGKNVETEGENTISLDDMKKLLKGKTATLEKELEEMSDTQRKTIFDLGKKTKISNRDKQILLMKYNGYSKEEYGMVDWNEEE